jgi:hypothetical protein
MVGIGIGRLFIGLPCVGNAHLSYPAWTTWDLFNFTVGNPIVQDNGLCTLLQPKVGFEVVHPR